MIEQRLSALIQGAEACHQFLRRQTLLGYDQLGPGQRIDSYVIAGCNHPLLPFLHECQAFQSGGLRVEDEQARSCRMTGLSAPGPRR